jgi:hypothetical protein
MDITLEDLIARWRGREATLDIDLAPQGDDARQTFHYEGILDGPYLGDGPGVGLTLGSRVISGDIAVEGPFISFEPSLADGSSGAVISGAYVELRVANLPLIAHVNADAALWETTLTDGRAVRCRLVASSMP